MLVVVIDYYLHVLYLEEIVSKKKRERLVEDFYTPTLRRAAEIYASSDNMRPTFEDVAVAMNNFEDAKAYMADRNQQIADLIDVLLEDPKFLEAASYVWDQAAEQFWHKGWEAATRIKNINHKYETERYLERLNKGRDATN